MTTAVAVVLIADRHLFPRLVAITVVLSRAQLRRLLPGAHRASGGETAASRPFVAWGYPWSAAIVFGGAVALLIGQMPSGDGVNGAAALALVAVGLGGRAAFARKPRVSALT